MIYTGVDGKKSFSVNKSLLGKGWSPTQKLGKKICVVPSDHCFVKVEKALSQKLSDLKGLLPVGGFRKVWAGGVGCFFAWGPCHLGRL